MNQNASAETENQNASSETEKSKSPKDNKYANLIRAVWDETEAAAYLGLSRSSLRKGRMDGKRDNHVEPPPYLKLGRRIGYLKADLDAWLLSHRVEA